MEGIKSKYNSDVILMEDQNQLTGPGFSMVPEDHVDCLDTIPLKIFEVPSISICNNVKQDLSTIGQSSSSGQITKILGSPFQHI